MRKQGLIHLHSLLSVVRRHCEREDDRPFDFSEYDSLAIDESSIYRGKDAHEQAVFALAEAITTGICAEPTAMQSAPSQ